MCAVRLRVEQGEIRVIKMNKCFSVELIIGILNVLFLTTFISINTYHICIGAYSLFTSCHFKNKSDALLYTALNRALNHMIYNISDGCVSWSAAFNHKRHLFQPHTRRLRQRRVSVMSPTCVSPSLSLASSSSRPQRLVREQLNVKDLLTAIVSDVSESYPSPSVGGEGWSQLEEP